MGEDPRKVKLRPGTNSDAGSDLSHMDLESCTSEDPHHADVDSWRLQSTGVSSKKRKQTNKQTNKSTYGS